MKNHCPLLNGIGENKNKYGNKKKHLLQGLKNMDNYSDLIGLDLRKNVKILWLFKKFINYPGPARKYAENMGHGKLLDLTRLDFG